MTYLGKVVGQGYVRPVDAKVLAIKEFPVPVTKKELEIFGSGRLLSPFLSKLLNSGCSSD